MVLSSLDQNWDVIISGAGPAGSMAAFTLAKSGLKVLLVDKQRFPRDKVCGCCLSPRAIAPLKLAGLSELIEMLEAMPLQQLLVCGGTKRISFPLVDSYSVSRAKFDNAMVQAATAAGALFADATACRLLDNNEREVSVTLQNNAGETIVSSRILLVADGLGGTTLKENDGGTLHSDVSSTSRVGIGAISTQASDFYDRGTIYMAYGKEGYLGLVRLEDGRTDIAAAFDPATLRHANGPQEVARRLLTRASLEVPLDIDSISWKGTVALTRHRSKVAGPRVFVIGDAASYIEPFTGEGIGWALSSGQAVASLVIEGVKSWRHELVLEWITRHHAVIGKRQQKTQWVAEFLRHDSLAGIAAEILERVPGLTRPLVQFISTPSKSEREKWLS